MIIFGIFISNDATTTSPSDGGKSERAVEIPLVREDEPGLHRVSVRLDGVGRLVDVFDVLMMIMVVDVVTEHLTLRRLMTTNTSPHLVASSAQSRQETPISPDWNPSRGEKNLQLSAWLGQAAWLWLIRPALLSAT